MNSTLLSCVHFHGRHNRLYVRWNLNLTFEASGAKTDPTHFRHLSPSPIPPTAHRAAFCLTSFPQNHWLLPCHRWNYVAMVFWPMEWHFQERSLVSVSPLFRVYKCTQAEGGSLLSRNLQNRPPTHPSTLETTHSPFLSRVRWTECSPSSASNPHQIILNLKLNMNTSLRAITGCDRRILYSQ